MCETRKNTHFSLLSQAPSEISLIKVMSLRCELKMRQFKSCRLHCNVTNSIEELDWNWDGSIKRDNVLKREFSQFLHEEVKIFRTLLQTIQQQQEQKEKYFNLCIYRQIRFFSLRIFYEKSLAFYLFMFCKFHFISFSTWFCIILWIISKYAEYFVENWKVYILKW